MLYEKKKKKDFCPYDKESYTKQQRKRARKLSGGSH